MADTPPGDPERALVFAYAPAGAKREALRALLTLDETLGDVVRTTTQPAIGQIRLAWWREALAKLDRAPPPAMPVLEAVAAQLLPHGIDGARLATLVEGWEVLIEAETLDDAALRDFASGRGGLFAIASDVLGGDATRATTAGEGWALVDLARYSDDRAAAKRALALARPMLSHALAGVARPLGLLALSARLDARAVAHGSPRRAARLAWFGLTGR